MSNFKPSLSVITRETNREAMNSYGKKSPYQRIHYDTYRELKKNIKRHLEENLEANISVSRSKRGEWGEWYETWTLSNGVAGIIKSGWM